MPKKFKIRCIPGWSLLEYVLVRSLVALINCLPISFATWIARRSGDLMYLLPKRRGVALKNLRLAYPDGLPDHQLEMIARESFRNVATSLMEFFRIPSMLNEAAGRFEFEGTEHLDRAFEKGNGIIFTISHLGSWEYLAFLPFLKGYPCSVVVREIRNPYLFNWAQELREKTKLIPINRTDSARGLLKELKQNHLLAILIDQWSNRGVWSEFFGSPTGTTSIPARLAHQTGAALIPGYCLRMGAGKYRIVILPEVSVAEDEDYERNLTMKLNRLLEKEILKYPEQWNWGHRRWKAKERTHESILN